MDLLRTRQSATRRSATFRGEDTRSYSENKQGLTENRHSFTQRSAVSHSEDMRSCSHSENKQVFNKDRDSFTRRSVRSPYKDEDLDSDCIYNGTENELDVYASVPLFEDAPSPSFPVIFGETDLAKRLGIRGESCTVVFAPQVFAIVRKSSVVFQCPYASIKSYSVMTERLSMEFGRVDLHGEGKLIMHTKYNVAMKECLHVNTEHVRRKGAIS